MRSSSKVAPWKKPLKASTSPGRWGIELWVGKEPGSHEPCAATIMGAARHLSHPSETIVTSWEPSIATAFQGCHTSTPCPRAASRRVGSSTARAIVLPHSRLPCGRGIGAVALRSPASNPTRRVGGPPSLRSSGPTPIASSTGSVVAETNSPHTLRLGNAARSTIATRLPSLARKNAAVDPAGPAPRTIAS